MDLQFYYAVHSLFTHNTILKSKGNSIRKPAYVNKDFVVRKLNFPYNICPKTCSLIHISTYKKHCVPFLYLLGNTHFNAK